jgi:hypothetical protein
MSDEPNGDEEVQQRRQRTMLWQVIAGDVLCGVGFGVLVLSGVSFEMAAAMMVALSVVLTTAIVLRSVSKKRQQT